MKNIVLELTPEQAEKLSEVLWECEDSQDSTGKWSSEELEELRAIIDKAIEENQR